MSRAPRYKLLNGKYVAPAAIEEVLTRSPLIAQAVVTGSDQARGDLLYMIHSMTSCMTVYYMIVYTTTFYL